jgi:hypothetical protein
MPEESLGFKSITRVVGMGSSDRNSAFAEKNQILDIDCSNMPRTQQKRLKRGIHGIGGIDEKEADVCLEDDENMNSCDSSVSCTTFNILAPVYKRMDSESCRESQFRDDWQKRNQKILDMLLEKRSSIICLQELWVGNEELVEMYERNLGNHGYEMYKFGRTNNREDGLFTAVRKDHFRVVRYREWPFNDCGDRVAQLLHVQSVIPFPQSQTGNIRQETLVVNTHLMFPHDSDVCLVRLRQVYKILEFLDTYKKEYKLSSVPIILCGDWNGTKRGHVYKFLRSQGFASSYDTAHHYTDSDADAHKWVSHRNHRGNICGVDFIWLLNPNNWRKPLKASWNEAVFGIIKSKLNEAGLKDRDAFCFFKSDKCCDNYVTFPEFKGALQQLTRSYHKELCFDGLNIKEIEDLFGVADTDKNGIIDYEEFQRMLLPLGQSAGTGNWLASHCTENNDQKVLSEKPNCISSTIELNDMFAAESSAPLMLFGLGTKLQDLENLQGATIGFHVKKAFLFPPEVERGMWPENYLLSDHAPLTVVFDPVGFPMTHEAVC